MWFDRRDMKQTARNCMRTTVPKAIWVALVFYLINYALTSISETILFGPEVQEIMSSPEAYMDALESGYFPNIPFHGMLLSLAVDVVSIILSVGFSYYTLCISRGIPAGFGNLFDGFGLFFKILWLNIRMGIVIFLWSLLFVVPGIIAAYKYSMSFYVLLDHPDWSAKMCMRESKRIMQGHKWELFVLELSFIGWNLLTIVPFVSVFVTPYRETTYSVYYNRLIGWQPEPSDPALPEKAPWEY